ncbi:hypothetical protein [Microseira wollei]|uniref:hypothetical protein n=1 Tax=Microseira wollei TaxID=467598 RepID=UPI001CFE6792|nr:hypothetical protein [Microseira wollei]
MVRATKKSVSNLVALIVIKILVVATPATCLAQEEENRASWAGEQASRGAGEQESNLGAGNTSNLTTKTDNFTLRAPFFDSSSRGELPITNSQFPIPNSQLPTEVVENPDAPGVAPSLQPQPSTPGEVPFQPQNLPLLPLGNQRQPEYRANPGITMINPSAYGKSWGSASVGVGLQTRTRFTNSADGVFGIGIGLGDARRWVGLDVGVTLTDLWETPAADGTVSFKLHRQLPGDFTIAVGVQNAIAWGNTDGGTSPYGVVTKLFRLQESTETPFSQLYLSVGVGSGQFRSELDIQNDRDSIDVFGSVAVRVVEPVSAIAEWTGQDLTLGLSVVPFGNIPLVITPAVTDITGKAGDGSRFILGVGYLISF